MRLLAIDVGNTRTKTLLWNDGTMSAWDGGEVDCALASVTGVMPDWKTILPGVEVELLSSDTPLPISIDYGTPETLGADRMAAACGAWALTGGCDCVVVDAGTCITIDVIPGGAYRGGAILPGIGMKFKALNTFTARLPLLDHSDTLSLPQDGLTGRSTAESMTAGVVTATQLAVEAMVERHHAKYPQLKVVATGGDAELICGKHAASGEWRVERDLVAEGLIEIMKYKRSIEE